MTDLIERARFLAAGQSDPHSATITELCGEIERLRGLTKQSRRVRNFSSPEDVFEAVPVRAFDAEQTS